MSTTAVDMSWRERAACRGVPLDVANRFFPGDDNDCQYDASVRALCSKCPVRAECLSAALAAGEQHGMWGGTTPRERRRILARRAAAARTTSPQDGNQQWRHP